VEGPDYRGIYGLLSYMNKDEGSEVNHSCQVFANFFFLYSNCLLSFPSYINTYKKIKLFGMSEQARLGGFASPVLHESPAGVAAARARAARWAASSPSSSADTTAAYRSSAGVLQ
jgi:hypothetical protein